MILFYFAVVMTTLKPKHSLLGRRIFPVVFMMSGEGNRDAPLARLKTAHPLTEYSMDDLAKEFLALAGETHEEVLKLAGKDSDRSIY